MKLVVYLVGLLVEKLAVWKAGKMVGMTDLLMVVMKADAKVAWMAEKLVVRMVV